MLDRRLVPENEAIADRLKKQTTNGHSKVWWEMAFIELVDAHNQSSGIEKSSQNKKNATLVIF